MMFSKNSRSYLIFSFCILLLGFAGYAFSIIAGPSVKLIILDPGHGHATFMQSAMRPEIDPEVHIYAPEGPDVQLYMNSINRANERKNNPTSWKLILYTGPDYLEKMLSDKKGNTVLISGNNLKKSNYILQSVQAGFHVIADKPMAITDLESLKKAFTIAKKNKVLLFDPMDLRYDISNIMQKELSQIPELFGTLQKGSLEHPALVQANLHHYLKGPAGQTGVRPAWFFDTDQQGHGLVDVSTHLIDLNQWIGFPEKSLDYKNDIKIISSKEWPSKLSPSQFKLVTKEDKYPEYLRKDIRDSILYVYSNGEINYTVKGIHSKVTVLWNFKEPPGSSDTHYSLMNGTRAGLEIRQGKEEGYKATLYIKPQAGISVLEFEKILNEARLKLQDKYPGTEFIKKGDGWEVTAGRYQRSNSADVAVSYIQTGNMPQWEVPNMLAKYFTTTEALKKAKRE